MGEAEYKRWYGTSRWKRLRAKVLKAHPTCQLRLAGCDGVATQVDHRIPARDRPDLFYVEANCQSSCRPCNIAKGGQRSDVSADRPPALAVFDTPDDPFPWP